MPEMPDDLVADSYVLDPSTTPLGPERIGRLITRGMPREAVRDDGTLDPDVLARHGWWLVDGHLGGPPG